MPLMVTDSPTEGTEMAEAALYIRVLKTDQTRDENLLADEQNRLIEWAKTIGHTVGAVYCEPEKSTIDDLSPSG